MLRPATLGYSLIELLVTITIIAILASIVLVTLAKVRSTAKSFVCKNNLKTVAFEFIQFADDLSPTDRGDSEALGRNAFHIEDFQEKLYRIDEFWGPDPAGQRPYKPSAQPLMCPGGPKQLLRSAGLPCSNGAVGPARNVTIGFNMRLDRASVRMGGRWILRKVRLTHRVLEHPSVPLAFEVDGEQADRNRRIPYYAAPPAGDPGLYGDGTFWFPKTRHGRRVNAAFVGGHVLSAPRPENQADWDWRYQHPPD